jgi:rhodanese-related sulfurtransferase
MKHSQAFENLVAEVKPRIKEVSIDNVVAYQKAGRNFLLIDVREDHEWQDGHAAGAMHLGRGILERDIEKVEPAYNREIVLYCGGGYRSAMAADQMQKMGYTNVFSMAGGIRAWREAGLPEEKP